MESTSPQASPARERGQPVGVAQRRAVAEAGQRWAQLGQASRRLPVAGRVVAEWGGWLVQSGNPGGQAHVGEHVADDQDPVALAPQGDVPGRVAGRLQDREPRHLVPFAQRAGDRVSLTQRQARGQPCDHALARAPGGTCAHAARLHGGHLGLAAPQRNGQNLADGVTGALVIGVGVRERVCKDGAPAQLAQDPPLGPARTGVDQHVVEQVHVDRVGRQPVQLEEVFRQPSHLLD